MKIRPYDNPKDKFVLEMAYLNHVRFHPDGRQITFMGKAEKDEPVSTEVWVMENFLPESTAVK